MQWNLKVFLCKKAINFNHDVLIHELTSVWQISRLDSVANEEHDLCQRWVLCGTVISNIFNDVCCCAALWVLRAGFYQWFMLDTLVQWRGWLHAGLTTPLQQRTISKLARMWKLSRLGNVLLCASSHCNFNIEYIMAKLQRGPINGVWQMKVGYEKSRFLTNILLYLGNDTK